MSALIAIVIGLVAMVLLFKVVFSLLAIGIGLALAVGAYFLAAKFIGRSE